MGEFDFFQDEKPNLHVPQYCVKCKGRMIYQGVGEYQCEKCGEIAFDDYGKVRNFLEEHPGSTAFDVEEGTGVRRDAIGRLLKEDRIEVKPFVRTELGKLI